MLIILGGPLQTMLFGTTGFVLLCLWRKKGRLTGPLSTGQWVAVVLTFFWSRQVFNFVMSVPAFLSTEKLSGDEPRISRYLGLPDWSFGLAAFIPAIIILYWVVFRAIPAHQRLSFLMAGLAGSMSGWFIWMYWLGPIVLP